MKNPNVFILGSFYQPRTKTQVPSCTLPVKGGGGVTSYKLNPHPLSVTLENRDYRFKFI